MNVAERIKLIFHEKPFSLLPENETTSLAELLEERNYPPDTLLFTQNKSEITSLMIILKGSIELFYDKQGEIILRNILKDGDIFGGISIINNNGIALRSVRTISESTFLTLPKEDFIRLCRSYPAFNQFFSDAVKQRLKDEAYASLIAAGQAYDFLLRTAPFSFLPDEVVSRTARELSVAHYPKGKVVYIQGQSRVKHLHIIQKGAGEQYILKNNNKTLKAIVSEGEIYGGISMLINHGLSVRTFEIIEDAYLYLLGEEKFLELCKAHPVFSEFFTDIFGRRMLDKTYAATVAKTYQCQDETLQVFNQTVESIAARSPVYCVENTTIQDAAIIMTENKCSSILVKSQSGGFIGLVTDNDLRKKVIATGYGLDNSVRDIMSSPLQGISSQALSFEAMLTMIEKGIKHLSVIDGAGDVIGVVTNRDLLYAQGQSPFFLISEIKRSSNITEVAELQKQLPTSVHSMVKNGANSRNITRLITAVSDSILEKIIGFVTDVIGPPPIEYAFMILGSDGRKEQTLKTDQDNAIVYRDVSEGDSAEIKDYFEKFGEMVCTQLDEAGYAFCKGDVMARNPRLRRPLSVWKSYFADWIDHASPEDLLQSSIFFDFRLGYGSSALIEELRTFLFSSLFGWAGFFRRMTENALHFKPPIGFFKNFVVESRGEHKNKFDIKSAMMPIVDLARIYALKYKIEETNTLERIKQVYHNRGMQWSDYNELEQGYSFLMHQRLVRQITAIIEEGRAPDNYINPKKLSRIEQTMLKEIFNRIEKFQGGLGLEFTGIA